ncbi:MAG: hypothetical protein PHT07_10280 [Paludibacter sp.]|nr:hypothetical protein [Paludibacter sp.]
MAWIYIIDGVVVSFKMGNDEVEMFLKDSDYLELEKEMEEKGYAIVTDHNDEDKTVSIVCGRELLPERYLQRSQSDILNPNRDESAFNKEVDVIEDNINCFVLKKFPNSSPKMKRGIIVNHFD